MRIVGLEVYRAQQYTFTVTPVIGSADLSGMQDQYFGTTLTSYNDPA
jgi:hypothetical protein